MSSKKVRKSGKQTIKVESESGKRHVLKRKCNAQWTSNAIIARQSSNYIFSLSWFCELGVRNVPDSTANVFLVKY